MAGCSRSALLLLGLLAATALVPACAHSQPRTVAESLPLDMPVPPPRIIENGDAEVPQPVGAPVGVPSGIDELNRSEPTRPAAGSTPPRGVAARPTDSKADTAPIPETPKPPEDRSQAPSPLQATPTQREGEVEAGIRAVILRAQNDLNRVDYRALSVDARTQYDTAKGFITQAQDALRARNLIYAGSLASKAATIAGQLAGR